MIMQADIKKVFFWLLLAAFGLYVWEGFLSAFYTELTDAVPGKKLYDDAYMFLRYAKQWLAGYGESWNGVDGPVYGNTSQLHFFVVLALRAFTSYSDRLVLSLSSALPAMMFLLYLPWVCARHATVCADKSFWLRYGLWAAAASGAFIYFSSIGMHFKTGMDTCLSLLLHLLLIDQIITYTKSPQRFRLWVMVGIVYLAFLTRPDNLLTCVLFPLAAMIFISKNWKAAVLFCVSTGLLLVADALIKWWYFGDILPLAFYVKQKNFYDGFNDVVMHSPWFSFSHFLYGLWPFVLVIALFANRKNLLMLGVLLIPAFLTIGYYFTIQTIMNLEARFFFPFTIYFVMAAVLCMNQDWKRLVSWRGGIILGVFIALYMGIGWLHENRRPVADFFTPDPVPCDDSVLNRAPGSPRLPPVTVTDSYHAMTDMLTLMPAGASVAMTEHGYVGAFNIHVNILDMIGLHNPYVAHQGYSADWFYTQKPDAIWVPHWSYTCINAKTFMDVRFQQEYDFYPLLFVTGYAIRKDSPHYDQLNIALKTVWERLYPGLSLEDYRRKPS